MRNYRTGLFKQSRFRNITLSAIPYSEVRPAFPALHVRTGFPMQATTACQPLPHTCTEPQVLCVNGSPVSEYYRLIRPPRGHWPSYLVFRIGLPVSGTSRVSQVLVRFSRHMPRSLWTPADPRKAHQSAFSVLASGPLIPSPSTLGGLLHRRDLRGCIKTSGSAVFLVAYVVPCLPWRSRPGCTLQ